MGCGEGRFCRMLADKGAVITGVDACRKLIQSAENNRVAEEIYRVIDVEDVGCFDDGIFDLAISYLVLIDLLNFEKSIKEAYRVP